MIKRIRNQSKKEVFIICQDALVDAQCEITYSNFSEGIIEAKRTGNLLSYGNTIAVSISIKDKNDVAVKVNSQSIGMQVFDWGVNSKIERTIIHLISKSYR